MFLKIILGIDIWAETNGKWYGNNHNISDIFVHLIILAIGITVFVDGINSTYSHKGTGLPILYKNVPTTLSIIALALFTIDSLKRDNVLIFRKNLPFIVFSRCLIFSIIYAPIYFTYQYLIKTQNGDETIYTILLSAQGSTVSILSILFIFSVIWTFPYLKHKQA